MTPGGARGVVFDIQRLCVQDGPGIRTTVFFKGCPLRCLWCHNPESLSARRQLIFRSHKCARCAACVAACPRRVHSMDCGRHVLAYSRCEGCGSCIRACCYDALEILGKPMTAGEVVKAVELDRPYFADGGGATLSGGEPMAQADFATELARRLCDCGISVAMETCGFAAPEQFQRIAPYIDLFLFDYKATGSVLHKELTGVEPDVILRNLRLVNDMDKRIILRCPMIPGVNDSDAHLEAIADLANRLANIIEVHILPYHRIGEGKRVQLGEAPSLGGVEPPGAEVRRAWIETLRKLGCDAKLI